MSFNAAHLCLQLRIRRVHWGWGEWAADRETSGLAWPHAEAGMADLVRLAKSLLPGYPAY